jgi:hypothetical protein
MAYAFSKNSLDKPELTNYKHQISNKFQVTISKSASGASNASGLAF